MPELIWQGKYDADGKRVAPLRVSLPFQTVETVNESSQQRQKMLDLFSTGRDPEWRNRLIWGDKKYVLPSLLPEFAGKVDLIYIDPPFATGADFSFQAEVGDESFEKEASILEQKAYRDTWGTGTDGYLKWFYETAIILSELLSDQGSMYVHCDWHMSASIRQILEEIFGVENFDSEIIWKRKDAQSSVATYGNVHDTIFFIKKPNAPFNKQYIELSQETADTWYTNEELVDVALVNRRGTPIKAGTVRRFNKADISAPGLRIGTEAHYEWKGKWPPSGRHWAYRIETMRQLEQDNRLAYSNTGRVYEKRYLDESIGVPAQTIWSDISFVRGMSRRNEGSEHLNYPTQKPEALLERIIKASSNEGDLVLDCFCGSGTTAAVAEKLGRRWITCDLGRFAIHTARKRLLAIEGVKPFVVQNLGKYERQAWQNAEFGPNAGRVMAQYRRFLLDLYHAEPLESSVWLHGKKGRRLIHVGAVDSPVTPDDVKSMAIELRKLIVGGTAGSGGIDGIDVLGWDFALETNETSTQIAREAGIDVKFIRIPREVLEKKAVDQGDIQFFELAALSVDVKTTRREVHITLTDFMVPPDDVPKEVLDAVKKWDAWIDYWAVDWDYKGDAFHNQWQSYRTRRDRSLLLTAGHEYDQPGTYTILVKVIDILGNDTTKAVDVVVK